MRPGRGVRWIVKKSKKALKHLTKLNQKRARKEENEETYASIIHFSTAAPVSLDLSPKSKLAIPILIVASLFCRVVPYNIGFIVGLAGPTKPYLLAAVFLNCIAHLFCVLFFLAPNFINSISNR